MNAIKALVWAVVLIGSVAIAQCQTTVSGTTCTENGSECSTITHAVCVAQNCKCETGYFENVDKCDAIYGSTCFGTFACTGFVNSACTNGKCECATDFSVKNNICVKAVSGTTCTDNGIECDDIDNAECGDTKCQCKDGFVENADTCDAKSGAVSVKSAVALMFGCLIMLLVRAL